jgi:hypothetical protein
VGIGERAAVREEGVGLVGETQEMHKKVGFRILVRYGESVIRASEWVLEESERWVLWRGGRERRRELGLLVLWGSDRQSRKSREVGGLAGHGMMAPTPEWSAAAPVALES